MGDLNKTRQELKKAAAELIRREKELCLLDSYVGDGDHGTTVRKGFEMIRDIADRPAADIEGLFINCAYGVMEGIGGAIGPILAALFLGFAEGARGKTVLLLQDWGTLFACAQEHVMETGGAKPGDSTLVDTLEATNRAFKHGGISGQESGWQTVAHDAYRGAISTKDMEARMGRAKYLGEKSIGYVDAGAMTLYYFIQAVAEAESEKSMEERIPQTPLGMTDPSGNRRRWKMRDYSFIRGFCYTGGHRVPETQLRRELGYAASLRLNSARIWLSEKEYLEGGRDFLDKVRRFVRIAYEMGITTMPILFNGNGLDPDILERDAWIRGDRYVEDVVGILNGEPGLLLWDVMNEPSCNDYIRKAPEGEKNARWDKVTGFLNHYCKKVKELAPDHAVTIGHTYISDVSDTLEAVDVISFHDYLSTQTQITETYEEAVRISELCGKPFINSELCCLCRANPYDLALRKCREYNAGWYLFELMICGYWGDVHGIFYEDGTVRDPSIPAAVLGFYRNRSESAVLANANKEGYAQEGIRMVREALEENTEVFRASSKPIDVVLEAAEFCANLLEACELVPMHEPPTVRIERIRKTNDEAAARRIAYQLAEILKKECLLV